VAKGCGTWIKTGPQKFFAYLPQKFFVYQQAVRIFAKHKVSFMLNRNINNVIGLFAAIIIVVVIIIPALPGGGA
jgi:hypothetical protein